MLQNFNDIGIKPMIPGYYYGADLTIINTMYQYPRKNENGNDPYVDVSPFEVTGYSNRENMWQRLRK